MLPGVPGEEKPAKAAGLENLNEEEKSTHLQEVCFLRYVGLSIHFKFFPHLSGEGC